MKAATLHLSASLEAQLRPSVALAIGLPTISAAGFEFMLDEEKLSAIIRNARKNFPQRELQGIDDR